MSAIWGYLNLDKDNNRISERVSECADIMEKPYESCAIDRFSKVSFDNGFFACGIQYFTEEAELERLPIRDAHRNLIFTGDIILNARENLVDDILGNSDMDTIISCYKAVFGSESEKEISNTTDREELLKWPDGALSYLAYVLWGDEFTDHIEGLFAIAVYNTETEEFKLLTDHMGCRCIYYSICDNELFFSTLCRPIIKAMPERFYGINEKFIAGAEFDDTPAMLLFPGLTPFENIEQVVRGHMVSGIRLGDGSYNYSIDEYWNPMKNAEQRIKLNPPREKQDAYYKKVFLDTFETCVKDAIRSSGNIAATMSSGLDSTSVATVAAKLLSKDNKKLYSFTSIPLSDYVSTYDDGYIVDESDGVRKLCANYSNIEMNFVDCDGESAFTEMDELVDIFEVPGKAFINLVWVKDALSKMKMQGCKVHLNGQFGNFTLSSGDVFTRFFHELYRGNYKEAKAQLAAFGKRYSVPRKVLVEVVTGTLIKKVLFTIGIDLSYNKSFDIRYLKKELLKKHEIRRTDMEYLKSYGVNECEPRSVHDKMMLSPLTTGMMGISDTKLSLYYGVVFRDPTRDKRVVDMCIAFPDSQFTEKGVERRLAREYMDGYLPKAIRHDPGHRGVQSPDSVLRMQRFGTTMKNDGLTSELFNYMNEESVRELFSNEVTQENHRDMIRILALDRFLKAFGTK